MKDCTTHVGIDAHKKEHNLAMLLPDSQVPEEWSVPNDPGAIRRMVGRLKKRCPGAVVFAYEAGVCGFSLQRQIEKAGARCLVIAPSLVPVQPGQRVRTDRRDARKLARYLRAGMLTEVQPPTEPQEAVRDLCRQRDAARRDLTRVRHQVSKFLLRRGRVYVEGNHWTQRHLRWLRALRFEQAMAEEVFGEYVVELEHRRDRLARLDRRLKEVAGWESYRRPVGWLRCFRGIDTLTALSLLAELHGKYFDSAPRMMSFLGLTPSEDSSGEVRRRGPITKAGNGRARRLLVEAAWHQRHRPRRSKALAARRAGQPEWVVRQAERAQQRLHRRYWRLLEKGKLPVQAATAVARELAGFLWGVLRLAGEDAPAAGDAGADVGRPAGGRVPRSSLRDDPRCRGGACPPPPARHPARAGAAAGGKARKRPRVREFLEGA